VHPSPVAQTDFIISTDVTAIGHNHVFDRRPDLCRCRRGRRTGQM